MKRFLIINILWICSTFTFSQNIENGYTVFQRVELTDSVNGIDGFMQILQDERLKSDEERNYWCFSEIEYLNAVLEITDKNGKIMLIETLKFPVANLVKTFLYYDFKPTYLLTINNWSGFGRETGHLTYFIEIENKKLSYVVCKDGLQSSLGSDWIISNYKKEKSKQIFYVESTRDSNLQNICILKRYFYDGKDWNYKEKSSKYDWWEKGESVFPPIEIFP